jgi:hypothetical protein
MFDTTEILTAVRNRFAGVERYDTTDARIVQSKLFLWGEMHSIRFKRKDGSAKTVYVWEGERDKKTGVPADRIQIFEDTDEVVSFVSLYRSDISNRANKIARESFLAKISLVDLISGTIAILLTVTIIYVTAYQEQKDVPGILANALTTILGFYFGRATTSAPAPTPA